MTYVYTLYIRILHFLGIFTFYRMRIPRKCGTYVYTNIRMYIHTTTYVCTNVNSQDWYVEEFNVVMCTHVCSCIYMYSLRLIVIIHVCIYTCIYILFPSFFHFLFLSIVHGSVLYTQPYNYYTYVCLDLLEDYFSQLVFFHSFSVSLTTCSTYNKKTIKHVQVHIHA